MKYADLPPPQKKWTIKTMMMVKQTLAASKHEARGVLLASDIRIGS
jgi:hypothetical protein